MCISIAISIINQFDAHENNRKGTTRIFHMKLFLSEIQGYLRSV